MSPTRKPRTRRYSSPARTEQAESTRRKVIDAATQLFLERGFARATVSAVASVARVSAETIYATFENKRRLLEAVIDATIIGPTTSVPLEEQSEWDDIARQPTARARLRAYVAFSCGVLSRTSPIHHVIRAAADSEPFAVALGDRLLRERLASNVKHLRDYLGDELREGFPLRRAAERYCALSSPEMHHLLTVKLGWSRRMHQEWLGDMAERELLGAR